MIKLLCAMFVLFVLSVNFFTLGLSWLDSGIGLHPVVAFPLATITLVIAFWVAISEIN